jgi:hypothetical protein
VKEKTDNFVARTNGWHLVNIGSMLCQSTLKKLCEVPQAFSLQSFLIFYPESKGLVTVTKINLRIRNRVVKKGTVMQGVSEIQGTT